MVVLLVFRDPPGGGGTPYNGLEGEAPPKGVPFSGWRYIEGYRDFTRLRVVSNFDDSSGSPFSHARVYFVGMAKIRDYSQSGFYELKYRKGYGILTFRYLKGPFKVS